MHLVVAAILHTLSNASTCAVFAGFFAQRLFHLPKPEEWLGERTFILNDEVKAVITLYFAELDKTYNTEGIKKLQENYVEK